MKKAVTLIFFSLLFFCSIQSKDTQSDDDNTFTCDGRKHCSEMTSCEEARYFLRNCPDVEMDGDNDGVPCEDQWCR